ncbi:putative ribonuclease H-like domain-containing protein [Tanacetum coccineum]
MPEPVVNEPKVVSQPKVWSDAPIIEEYESDSEDEHVSLPTKELETPSFAFINTAVPTNAARKVNTVKPILNNARPKLDYPQRALQNKGIVDSGCSRHMSGNKDYLAEYQDFNGGPVAFSRSKCYIAGKGKGPTWLFDLDYLTDSMNYQPMRFENQANKHACPKEANHSVGTEDNIDAGNYEIEAESAQVYFVLPIWSFYTSTVKSSKTKNVGEEPNKNHDLKTDEKPVAKEDQVFLDELERLKRQEHDANNAAEALRKDTASPYGGLSFTDTDQDDSEIPALEDMYDHPTDGIFTNASYDDEGAVADFTNLETIVNVSPIPTSRINSIHPSTLILGDPNLAVQKRSKVTKSSRAYAFILVDLPYGKKAIGTKWVYKNKKDERGVVVRNKARLVAQGHRQEEGIDYDEDFAPMARIEAIRIFLAIASYMGFIVYQMDVKSTFLYGKIDKEVYVSQTPGFVDPKYPKKVYKVVKSFHGLHQAPRAWYATLSTFLLKSGYRRGTIDKTLFIKKDKNDIMVDIMFAVCACSRFQVTPNTSYLNAVKRIFRYLKGKPKLGLWYPRVSSFDLEAYSDSDYAGANLDRKSTTGGCQFLDRRLISWQCKKQTIVATSTIEVEYVAAANCANCRGQDAYEKKLIQVQKIHTDDNVADLLTKAFDVSSLYEVFSEQKNLNDGDVFHRVIWVPECNWKELLMRRLMGMLSSMRLWTFLHEAQFTMLSLYITATVAGKPVTISEASIRSDLLFDDADRIDTLNNQAIFDTIQLIGPSPSIPIPDSNPEGFGGNHGAKEIKDLKAQLKKLKKKARPVITYHKAWIKGVSRKTRLAGKKSMQKK